MVILVMALYVGLLLVTLLCGRRQKVEAKPASERYHVFYCWLPAERRVVYAAGCVPGTAPALALPGWLLQYGEWVRVTAIGYVELAQANFAAVRRQVEHGQEVNGLEYSLTVPTAFVPIEALGGDYIPA